MIHRFFGSTNVVGIFVAVVLLASLAVAAQVPTQVRKPTTPAKAENWTVPRTPDGQPDLQGFWTNTTYTPLERPKNVTKESYTEEEAVEAAKRAAEVEGEQTEPGTIPDVHYDFTQFGLDRSQGAMALNLRTSLIVDPADGKMPPLSVEGQKRAAARADARKRMGAATDAVQNQPLSVRCIIMDRAGPPMLAGAYNNNYQIVQVPGYVMILVEMIHDVRIIPIDGRPHLPQNVRQWTGSYVGHWEGETLVVETTNFSGKSPFQGSSENMRLTERFTRVKRSIKRMFSLDPWKAVLPVKFVVSTTSVSPSQWPR